MEYLMLDNQDYLNNLDKLDLVDNLDNLDLVDNLDLLPTLAHEDFSLMHLLLLQVGLADNLDLADNLVDQMGYLTQDNLDNHKVLYLLQQQVLHLRVDFSHYL